MPDAELYVVEVHDHRQAALVGHPGCHYVSPPQSPAQALALVAILLGCPPEPPALEQGPWRAAVAGGHRTIRLRPATAS